MRLRRLKLQLNIYQKSLIKTIPAIFLGTKRLVLTSESSKDFSKNAINVGRIILNELSNTSSTVLILDFEIRKMIVKNRVSP